MAQVDTVITAPLSGFMCVRIMTVFITAFSLCHYK